LGVLVGVPCPLKITLQCSTNGHKSLGTTGKDEDKGVVHIHAFCRILQCAGHSLAPLAFEKSGTVFIVFLNSLGTKHNPLLHPSEHRCMRSTGQWQLNEAIMHFTIASKSLNLTKIILLSKMCIEIFYIVLRLWKKLSFPDESFELTVAPSLAANNNEGDMQSKKIA